MVKLTASKRKKKSMPALCSSHIPDKTNSPFIALFISGFFFFFRFWLYSWAFPRMPRVFYTVGERVSFVFFPEGGRLLFMAGVVCRHPKVNTWSLFFLKTNDV